MKKGFTVVELIITFSLTVVIATFLLQLILTLNNLYQNSGVKTELLNKQFIISNKINKTLNEKELVSLTSCGNNCLNFNYKDSTKDVFKIDYSNNILQFGNFTTTLPNDTYFKNVNIDIIYSTTIDYNSNNAILNINIPIHNDKLNNEDFNVNIAYQFNSNKANISYVNFSGSDNYIVLKGATEQTINSKTAYVEEGYTVYDKNGNTINGNVEIDNPLETLPYKSGRYIIKYNLKDNNGNIVSQATRTVEVEPSVYEITNLVTNGSFEDGITGWEVLWITYEEINNQSLAIYGERLLNVNTESGGWVLQTIPVSNDKHIYYASIDMNIYEINSRNAGIRGRDVNLDVTLFSYTVPYVTDGFVKISSIFENESDEFQIWFGGDSPGGTKVYFDGYLLVDLTEAFGAGNEPSQEWCDENIEWFEGTTKISY